MAPLLNILLGVGGVKYDIAPLLHVLRDRAPFLNALRDREPFLTIGECVCLRVNVGKYSSMESFLFWSLGGIDVAYPRNELPLV